MLEETVKLLLELDWMSRCFVTNILLSDELGAIALIGGCLRMNILAGDTPYPSAAVHDACKVAWEAKTGYHRSEFLVDLLASLEVSTEGV
jgi:hypothetical protein